VAQLMNIVIIYLEEISVQVILMAILMSAHGILVFPFKETEVTFIPLR